MFQCPCPHTLGTPYLGADVTQLGGAFMYPDPRTVLLRRGEARERREKQNKQKPHLPRLRQGSLAAFSFSSAEGSFVSSLLTAPVFLPFLLTDSW